MLDLTLPTMSCGHCVQTVRRTVQRVDPQATVEVDLAARRVRIDSAVAPEIFDRALSEEGYAPKA